MQRLLLSALGILFVASASAQALRARIVDAKTGEPIPYANINVNNVENQISNEEGYFSISEANGSDDTPLAISFIGYLDQKLSVGQIRQKDNLIKMQEGTFELDEVKVAKPDPKAIMAEVNKNLKNNYKKVGQPVKDRYFKRNMSAFKPKTIDLEVTKSTGFSKKEIESANKGLQNLNARFLAKQPKEFSDVLFDAYRVPAGSKYSVVKATQFRDEKNSGSFEEIEKAYMNVILANLDTTKYYKMKSGMLPSVDSISFAKNKKKKKEEKKETEFNSFAGGIASFETENSVLSGAKFEFIRNPDWYTYTYEGALLSGQSEIVYVLKFVPRKGKANYVGRLYISESDYGVSRIEYKLAEGKKLEGLNLKWLLGIKFANNVAGGTMLYKKKNEEEGYRLTYASVESGSYFYLNRPMKFTEMAKDDAKVFAFDIKVEGDMYEKTELLNISESEISQADYDNAKPADFKYIRIKQYDAGMWSEYGAIEPVAELKKMEITDDIN